MTTKQRGNAKILTTNARALLFLTVALTLAFTPLITRSGEPKAPAAGSGAKLIGTWKLVSAKYGGEESKITEGQTTLKHVTPSQWMWASYGKDGKVTRAAGGTYTVKGDDYEETPEYGFSEDFDLIKGKAQKFKWKVDGNRWYHTGVLSNGLTIDEIWEQVEKK